MRMILRRAVAVVPAAALQILWYAALLKWLAPWAALINLVLSLLASLFVLYLITKQDEGTYKILWLLVILTFPLPGTALYLIFGDKRTTKPLRKRLEAVPEFPRDPAVSAPVYRALEDRDPRMAQTFRLIEDAVGLPARFNTGAKYYPLGDSLFPDMLEAIDRAERFILVEYFIVEPGYLWDTMVEHMAEKAARGVQVRVLYDDLGSISTYAGSEAAKLWKKGIQCVPFNPLLFIRGTLNYRDHRKMLIVDNQVAFSGGVNLADEYINRVERFGHWKDIGFRLTGPAAESYTRMFCQFWDAFAAGSAAAEFLPEGSGQGAAADLPEGSGEGAAPDLPEGSGRDAAADTPEGSGEDAVADLPEGSGEDAAPNPPEGSGEDAAADLPEGDGSAGGFVISYYDSPLRSLAVSNEVYIDLLSQAKRTAWFFTPYLMPGEALLSAFVRAARRGVDVRIIMPGIPDKKLVFRMSRAFYPVLLDAGVRIYEYTPGFVHAKGCVIDGVVGTVGTVNLDYRSLFLHFENNSLFYEAPLLRDLEADFLAVQAQCREAKLGETVKVTLRHWLMDGILRIFAPLC